LALALSVVGSLSLQPHSDPSFSDIMDDRDVSFGGKGSTQYVVKGSQKEFPQELLQELKIICEVQNPTLSPYLINWFQF